MALSVLVCCEKQPELDDLQRVVSELKAFECKVHLVDLANFTGETLKSDLALFDSVVRPDSLFGNGYKKLGLIRKTLCSFHCAWLLAALAKKVNATHVLYGVPIVFFRLLNVLPLRRYKTFSYVRSTVIADDKWRQRLPVMLRKLLNHLPLTRPYVADNFYCIDAPTQRYIKSLHGPDEHHKIFNVGSIYAANLMRKRMANRQGDGGAKAIRNVCFLSSAFSWHGDQRGGSEQVALFRELLKRVDEYRRSSGRELKLHLKLHPRDSKECYADLLESGEVEIMEQLRVEEVGNEFCFASVLSTLSYELGEAGFKSLYICNDFFRQKYAVWYGENRVSPISVNDPALLDHVTSPQASVIEDRTPHGLPHVVLATHIVKGTEHPGWEVSYLPPPTV